MKKTVPLGVRIRSMLVRSAPLVFGVLVIIALGGYMTLFKSSPGELAEPHRVIAGSSFVGDCNKCHGGKGMTSQCLKCHEEIQAQISYQKGYHHYLLKDKRRECAACHSEHNGKNFPLINQVSWQNQDLVKFNHPGVDYRLIGKHKTLKCEQCHQQKGMKLFVLPRFESSPRKTTFLGLTQKCMGCHKDPHSSGYAFNCGKCHDQKAFQPALFFNHDKFFPLKGAHEKVSCKQCHPVPTTSPSPIPAKFPFDRTTGKRCQDCHKSPHHVRWKEACESCHLATQPWRAADTEMTPARHALTGFSLWKPHHKALCKECHAPNLAFNQKYPDPASPSYRRREKDCETCHRDSHGGQFLPRHSQCMDCHALKFFKPPRYGVKDHVTYPLVGGHIRAACNSCHKVKGTPDIREFIRTPKDCAACHKDIHYGQFRKNEKTTCEECHRSAESWKRIIFNHETQSKFKLGEAHAKVACKECHPMVSVRGGIRLIQYKPVKSRCEDCHRI